jgi:hypothetical protein
MAGGDATLHVLAVKEVETRVDMRLQQWQIADIVKWICSAPLDLDSFFLRGVVIQFLVL